MVEQLQGGSVSSDHFQNLIKSSYVQFLPIPVRPVLSLLTNTQTNAAKQHSSIKTADIIEFVVNYLVFVVYDFVSIVLGCLVSD